MLRQIHFTVFYCFKELIWLMLRIEGHDYVRAIFLLLLIMTIETYNDSRILMTFSVF